MLIEARLADIITLPVSSPDRTPEKKDTALRYGKFRKPTEGIWMKWRMATTSFIVFLLGSASAAAQEKGQVGVTMGFPPSVGVIWHITDRIGVRPEVEFSHNWGDQGGVEAAFIGPGGTESSATTTSTTFVATGVSGLFYLTKNDGLSTFVSPGLSYARFRFKSDTAGDLPATSFESKSTSYQVRGAFGVQYAPHRRFSMFGQLGLEYRESIHRSTVSDDLFPSDDEDRSHGINTIAAVGLMFYFR